MSSTDSLVIPKYSYGLDKPGYQVRHRALMPWMFAYAEWLTLACVEDVPKRSARTAKASQLSSAKVTDGNLRILEAREDFQKYCAELAKGPLEQARAKFQKAFPTYIEAHAEALDTARRAGDYTAVARISEPILDRVMPKKAEGVTAATVTVVLTPQQVAGVKTYEAPPMLVQEEITTPLPDDDSSASSV